MEIEIFKELIIKYGFHKSRFYEATWIDQVKNINNYWDTLIRDINIEEFLDDYLKLCSKRKCIRRPIDDLLNMHYVLCDWREDLMTKVANQIAQFATDEVDGQFVKWNGSEMEFLFKLVRI